MAALGMESLQERLAHATKAQGRCHNDSSFCPGDRPPSALFTRTVQACDGREMNQLRGSSSSSLSSVRAVHSLKALDLASLLLHFAVDTTKLRQVGAGAVSVLLLEQR